MVIRQAKISDIDGLVEIDRKSYDDYGSGKYYFSKKIKSFPEGVLVVEENKKITGFIVFDMLFGSNLPEDFCDMKSSEKIDGKWIYIATFTTRTNYEDKKADSRLLSAAEEVAKNLSAKKSCVPLSKEHPFKANGVFEFWEMNGYRKIGEIKWKPNNEEFVDCWFYKKNF